MNKIIKSGYGFLKKISIFFLIFNLLSNFTEKILI